MTQISKIKNESFHITQQLSSSNKSACMKGKCTSVKKVSSKGSGGPQENSDISEDVNPTCIRANPATKKNKETSKDE